MEYCLKTNTQPSVSNDETKLYLNTSNNSNFVDQKVTYSYQVLNIETEKSTSTNFPQVRWVSFNGRITKTTGRTLSVTSQKNKFNIVLKSSADLSGGTYNWHNVDVRYDFR